MTWMEPLVFLAGVVMGTGSTITVKVMYGLTSVGLSGHMQYFEKPLFTTWIMFIAMMIALPIHYIVEAYQERQRRTQRASLIFLKQQYQLHLEERQKQASSTHRSSSRASTTSSLLNGNRTAHTNGSSDIELGTASISSIASSIAAIDTQLADLVDPEEVSWRTFFLLIIPSAFDLFGTALASIGLLFTTVSVYQLVRCSVIIATAILKVTVLGHKLSQHMWLGIGINTVAMIFVASTSFLDVPDAGALEKAASSSDLVASVPRDPRIGILFILLSCAVQASQYVFEEKVMTVDNAPPLVVVGMEGVWGTLLMPLVVFPWAYILPGTDYGGCVENLWDSYVMTRNSTAIQAVLVVFTLTVCLYNIFCIYVTFLLNSVWHAILDNFRPISVWSTDLLLFYVFTKGTFGEPWTPYSWLEVVGMFLLFLGTAVYNGTVRVPGWDYSDLYDDLDSVASGETASLMGGASAAPASASLVADTNGLVEDERGVHHVVHAASGGASGGTGTPTFKHVNISSPLLTRSPLVTKQLSHALGHGHAAGAAAAAPHRDLNSEFGMPSLSLNGAGAGGYGATGSK